MDRQKEQILAECQAEIRKHDFQANEDRRSFQNSSETIESHQEELHRAQAEELQRREQQLLHAQLLEQNWDLREAYEKSLNEIEELKKFQSSTFDTIARRRFVEDQDTILEHTGKIQELQNEIKCMNDSRDFQDAESVRSGHSHVTSQPVSFPPHPIPGGMLSRSIGMPSRKDGPPSIFDTHGISGNVFAGPVVSSAALYPQELNPWSSVISQPVRSSMAEKRTVSQKFSHLQWRRLFKELWGRPTTTADFRSSFRQIPHTINVCLLEDEIQDLRYVLVHNFLRKLCIGSKKWRWLMQWMN